VSDRTAIVWDERLAEYDFGPGHPLAPIRVQLAMRLAADFGLLSGATMITGIEPLEDDVLLRTHAPDYIAAVRAASDDPHYFDEQRGLGTADDPVFPHMHRASARVAAATLAAARAVHSGEVDHAVNLAGGLHHAMPGSAGGFCIYNDISVAIAWLLDQGVERVAYVDVDVHHGDGVQACFWDDPRVMTISLHEDPRSLFPGTGRPSEVGGPGAEGTAVNIALPAGTGDQGWLRALHGVVPDLLGAFAPEVLVTQQGVDTHFEDPLAHLTVSLDGQRMAFEALHRWAHRYAGGRWVAVGGGGYEWVDVVPRAWTHLIAIATGQPIPPESAVPDAFHTFVLEALGRQAPGRMTDGRQPWPKPFDQGFDAADPVDAAILATREAVFPRWGLVAEPDLWF
jgi:acetoin utilization protein AcuC